MADIVLFGGGQIAEVAKAYIDAHGADRVVGFTADAAFCRGETFAGLPFVAWESLETRFPPDAVKLLGPLSYRRLNEFRRDRHVEGKARGYAFASFIHPASHVYAAEVGENAFILEANVIQPFVRVGCGVMMWSGNHVGHHSVIGDYCFLASQVGISSNVRIGERSFLAARAGVNPGITIGEGCILSGGALVGHDLPANTVVEATPFSPLASYPSARLKRFL